MLLFQNSRIIQSTERPVAAGATVTAEGQALVATNVGGVFGVKPSTGAAGEIFAGVSLAQQLTPLYLPAVERLTVTAGLTVTVRSTPVGGTLRVYNVTKGAVVAAGVAAGNYSIVGNVITVVAGGATAAADVLEVGYRYSPTTLEAKAIQGDIPAGGAASLTLNSVGAILQGDVYTTEFDTSVDWTAANPVITLGANGLFTIGGAGAVVPNAYIVKVPSAGSIATGDSVLGIHFSV